VGHDPLVTIDLAIAEAEDGVPVGVEVEVSGAVVFERLAATVRSVGIDLNHKPLLPPEEVDRVRADCLVHLRRREAVAAT
jgi:hypothetical protein